MTVRVTDAERAAALAAGVPKANLISDWIFCCQLRLSLAEVESLTHGTMPESVSLALQAECAEQWPYLSGAVIVPDKKKRRRREESVARGQQNAMPATGSTAPTDWSS